MPKKITNVANPGGRIDQILKKEQFISMVNELNVIDVASITQSDVDAANISRKHISPIPIGSTEELIKKKIEQFEDLANIRLHEYLKDYELLGRKKDARDNKRKIDFLGEIDDTAYRLRELITKAPLGISDNMELEEISSQLEAVPHIIKELRESDRRQNLGLNDPYGGEYTELRHELVLKLHILYVDITGLIDWVSRIPDSKEYTNPFFKLLRLCYQAIGEDLSDRSIEDDIKNARELEKLYSSELDNPDSSKLFPKIRV